MGPFFWDPTHLTHWPSPFDLAWALLPCFLGLPIASTPPTPHTPDTPRPQPPLMHSLLLTTCHPRAHTQTSQGSLGPPSHRPPLSLALPPQLMGAKTCPKWAERSCLTQGFHRTSHTHRDTHRHPHKHRHTHTTTTHPTTNQPLSLRSLDATCHVALKSKTKTKKTSSSPTSFQKNISNVLFNHMF